MVCFQCIRQSVVWTDGRSGRQAGVSVDGCYAPTAAEMHQPEAEVTVVTMTEVSPPPW